MIALLLASLIPSTQDVPVEDLGWPRELIRDSYQIVIYQPQITAWEDLRLLRIEMAVAVTLGDPAETSYGVLRMSSESTANVTERTVQLDALEVDELVFGGEEGRRLSRLQAAVLTNLPTQTWEISLDRLLAGMVDVDVDLPEVEVVLDPPDIFYSYKPAILVQFLGEPEFEEVRGTGLEVGVNTNWDIFRDRIGTLYLLDGEGWLTASSLDAESWTVARALPQGMTTLPDEGFEYAREHVPGTPAESAPRVFVHDVPAELIVTEGKPHRRMVPNVALMWIENTNNDLFFVSGSYYVLLAGRWFRAPELEGPWSSAVGHLPAEFASIPEDHARADVLASVPGTPDAKAAAIQASLPHVGTVSRDATVVVTYEGEPVFEEIEGTDVLACTNTAFEIFEYQGHYFCCHRGVWFDSEAPRGTWRVSVEIPDALYSIPPESPYHDVTYVEPGSYDDEEVEVYCYPGYYGTYVYLGCPYYGTAWWLARRRAVIRWRHYPAHYYSYGCGVRYSFRGGTYVRFGRRYGPYGGCGFVRTHNRVTGSWGRGTYRYSGAYGSRAAGSHAARDVEAAGRVAGGSPYVAREAVRGRGGEPAVRAGARNQADIAARTRGTRPAMTPTTSRDGDLYAGTGSEVLRRDTDGNWSRLDGKSWRPVQRDAQGGFRDAPERTAQSNAPSTRDSARSAGAPSARDRAGTAQERRPSTRGQRRNSTRDSTRAKSKSTQPSRGSAQRLEREHSARRRGNQRAQSSRRGSVQVRRGGGRR